VQYYRSETAGIPIWPGSGTLDSDRETNNFKSTFYAMILNKNCSEVTSFIKILFSNFLYDYTSTKILIETHTRFGSALIPTADLHSADRLSWIRKIRMRIINTSVADPECFIMDPGSRSDHFLIPDPDSNIFSSRIPYPKWKLEYKLTFFLLLMLSGAKS
jgi:hypothetical protein